MDKQEDVLQVQGINAMGFGTIPKSIMLDKRLKPLAKTIYAYFCTYAGAGQTAFPRVSKITADLGIGKNAYYSHLKSLKDYGYIVTTQEKNKNGQFTHNLYTLKMELPYPQKRDTGERDTGERDTGEPYTATRDTIINSINNNIININSGGENEPAPAPKKVAYGEFKKVSLLLGQYEMLVDIYGNEKTAEYINRLDQHIASTGKRYADHYATIKKWIAEDERKDLASRPPAKNKRNRFCNFKATHKWNQTELEKMEQQFLADNLRDP